MFSTKNKKIPGKFKNETGEEFIRWMVALRAKMYGYETRTKQAKICKGTAKGAVAGNYLGRLQSDTSYRSITEEAACGKACGSTCHSIQGPYLEIHGAWTVRP